MSEKLSLTNSEEKKQTLLKEIIRTSTQSWAHINLAGEYDFLDGKDYKMLDLSALMELNLKYKIKYSKKLPK